MERENIKINIVHEGYRALAKEVKEASHGGNVLLFAEEGRAGDDAFAALAFEGMRVTRKNVPDEPSYDLFAELQKTTEGVMTVLAVGGVRPIEVAKAARTASSVPKILFPTEFSALSALENTLYFGKRGTLPAASPGGQSVTIDPDIVSASPLRPGLGYLASLFLEEADGAFERLILTGESPAASLRALKEKAALLCELREETAAADTLNAILSVTKLSQNAPRANASHVLAFLSSKKAGGDFSDYLFPAAYALSRIYLSYLGSLPLEHCPPPDRAENVRLLHKKCGILSSFLYKDRPCFANGYDERWRRTAEYREDFSEAIEKVPLSHLARLYRRTAHKEQQEISASDLLMLLSLTGEAVSGYPLIKHIKMTGLIEPLLKCG